ncbi:unnamed protein product, partial [Iphiclides podalirius]
MNKGREEGMNKFLVVQYIVAEFVISQKGKRMIQYNRYTYSSTPQRSPMRRWRCSSHSAHRCKAAIHTICDKIVRVMDQHSHPPPTTVLYK